MHPCATDSGGKTYVARSENIYIYLHVYLV